MESGDYPFLGFFEIMSEAYTYKLHRLAPIDYTPRKLTYSQINLYLLVRELLAILVVIRGQIKGTCFYKYAYI